MPQPIQQKRVTRKPRPAGPAPVDVIMDEDQSDQEDRGFAPTVYRQRLVGQEDNVPEPENNIPPGNADHDENQVEQLEHTLEDDDVEQNGDDIVENERVNDYSHPEIDRRPQLKRQVPERFT